MVDPRTGRPINFNFLPMLSSGTMGVMPHTVQDYSLTDPTDGAYGNLNFSALRDFMEWEAANDTTRRDVVFHPELNYWVNVDIDVPLLLPIAGERRLSDLRLLSFDEQSRWRGTKRGQAEEEEEDDDDDEDRVGKVAVDVASRPGTVLGQVLFDSGWEWGAWLSDVVAARAAWDPLVDTLPEGTPAEVVYATALAPIVQQLMPHPQQQQQLSAILTRLSSEQHRLLTLGAASGLPPPSVEDLREVSGWGLLSGRDAWTDILKLAGVATTQPDRIGFHDHTHSLYPRLEPLLSDMNATFSGIAAALEALAGTNATQAEEGGQGAERVQQGTGMPLVRELADAACVLALRAEFIALLYAATAPGVSRAARKAALAGARTILAQARRLVATREAHYRVSKERVGGWRNNPTACASFAFELDTSCPRRSHPVTPPF